jgi:hypothetical protein
MAYFHACLLIDATTDDVVEDAKGVQTGMAYRIRLKSGRQSYLLIYGRPSSHMFSGIQ